MKIVESNGRYMVYGSGVSVFDSIPVDTYQLCKENGSGFFLVPQAIRCSEKAYGKHSEKTQKILDAYVAGNRDMGVILSGTKGTGKTMLARMVCEKAIAMGYPVIIVKECMEGLEDFMLSVEQKCVVLFDEFEKNFGNRGKGSQETLLGLFDGLSGGEKLFIVTCNDTRMLHKCLLNRPGRFHYHFEMLPPAPDAIREYMEDNLNADAKKYIDEIIGWSYLATLTYDVLRAVAFELNRGCTLEETKEDLNVMTKKSIMVDISFVTVNGTVIEGQGAQISLTPEHRNFIVCTSKSDGRQYSAHFNGSDVIVNQDGVHINPPKVEMRDVANDAYERITKVLIKGIYSDNEDPFMATPPDYMF